MMENEKMTFITQELSAVMFQKLYEQKRTNRFCDITLLVNNKVIKAHRNVLACSSPYFDSILKHHKIIKEQLTINCLDSNTFDVIVNYMYTGQITIEPSIIEELLRLADAFLITKVIEYCIEYLGTNLNVENCLFTYSLTQRFRLKHLGNLVESWIINHLNEICERKEVLNLNLTDLQDFLKNKVFNVTWSKAIIVASEWVLINVEKRERDYLKLLRSLQWSNLGHDVIFKHLECCPLYSTSELCLFYFLQCLFENNLLLPNFKQKFEELQAKYNQFLKQENENCVGVDFNNSFENKNSEKENNVIQPLTIKPKLKNKKRLLLKKLMFCSLRPSLRMLLFKQKKVAVEDFLSGDSDGEQVDDKTGLKCPMCNTILHDSALLEQHLALSHVKEVTYKCSHCTFVCQFHGDYTNHMKEHFSGPPFKCDQCDSSFDQITKLIAHRSKHCEETIHQCTFCSYKTKIKQNYVNHLKTHAVEKNHKCEICNKAFRYKNNLDSHLQSHFSDKLLTCESCGFNTKFLSHMIAHKRIHAADAYRCSYPHCKFSSSKKNQLLTHAKTHNGVRPHSCNICGRGFMEKSHLVRHERIHLEEKPFKCSNCDYASSRRDKLKEHFTRHHGENASAKVPYKARPMRNNNTNNCPNSKSKTTTISETTSTANSTSLSFTPSVTTLAPNINQSIGTDLQDLMMQHQNHPVTSANTNSTSTLNTNYPHFSDATDYHHHTHTHNIQHQILTSGHSQRVTQHQNTPINHHMLPRPNHPTATSTAAAVAAAMMLDPRFHHNTPVPYPSSTPASMAMAAAVQSTQQIQAASGQHSEYGPTIQNCMALF